jgi:type II secretory pathway component PulK
MVLTLWVVVFLAFLASAIASHVSAHLQAVSDFKWGARSRAFGMRALAEALDFLQYDVINSYDSLQESWANDNMRFKDILYAGGSFSIVFERVNSKTGAVEKGYGLIDEGGKINLNRAPAHVLSPLFHVAGMTLVQADELGHFIVDWRDTDTVSEGKGPEACAGLTVPYVCKNADFEALEELWLMPGMTVAVYNVVRQELTLYGAGAVNANTATSLALRSFGLTSTGAERIVSWRSESGHFFENPSAIIARAPETGMSKEDQIKLGTAVAAGLVGTISDVYRGQVEAEFNHRLRKVAEFIIDRSGKVRWWRE